MIKISVIIPVYNGEKYLRSCLDSIAGQTINELEIIIVDNKSNDGSVGIIQEFMECWKSKRSIEFWTEDRQGNAYARNTGIQHAKGEYIAFVDQDDCVKAECFEHLYNEASGSSADIVVSGYEMVTPGGKIKRFVRLKQSDWSPYRVVAPWGKLYKRSLINDKQIRFLPVNKGEDIFFVFNAYNQAEQVRVSGYVGYKWLMNDESFSHTEHKKIDDNNSIMPVFEALQDSLFPLRNIDRICLEYFYIKTIVHEVIYCSRGKNIDEAYGYYKILEGWIDKTYPGNESNRYLRLFDTDGESLNRRFFIKLFWYFKKMGRIKAFLKMYTNIFR